MIKATESDAAARQGKPRTDGHHKKLGRNKAGLSQESQTSMALLFSYFNLDFRFLASITLRQYISVVLSPPVCGPLLR